MLIFHLCKMQNLFGTTPDYFSTQQLFSALILALIISLFSYKFKFLSVSGTISVFFMAIVIFAFGGWKWTLPMVTFFITSSLITKYNRIKTGGLEISEKNEKRDFAQVIANGGFASVLILINYFGASELIFVGFVSSIAAACADTWETEIGTFIKGKTYNISNFKKIQPGISGGISLAGTIAGIFGTFTIAISSLYWVTKNYILFIFAIVAAGFVGSLIDSFIGAVIERKNQCTICGVSTEKLRHCETGTKLVSGIKWINNDVVNFVSASFGGFFGILLTELILK